MQKLVWQNANGLEIDLTSGNYGITEWEGFSGTGLNIQSQTIPFQDGSVFLDALIEQRELSVTLAMQDNNNLETRYQQRREVISALNPKLGEGYLIYTNDYISKRIKCIPQIPIFENHNSDVAGTPKASLSWTACEPYWEDLNETVVELEYTGTNNCENNGDIPCQMKIDIITGNVKDCEIKNQNGEKIKIEGTINTDVEISTEVGNKYVESRKDVLDIKYINKTIKCVCYVPFLNKTIYSSDAVSMAYNDEIVVKIIGDNNKIAYSTDGINWTQVSYQTSLKLNQVIYSEERQEFVAVGCVASGQQVSISCISTDGINWDFNTSGNDIKEIYGICWSKEHNKYFAVSVKTPTSIYSSSDAIIWSNTEMQYSNILLGIIAYNNIVIAVGDSGIVYRTEDGATWERITTENSITLKKIEYFPAYNLFVAIGDGVLITSTEGRVWEKSSNEIIISSNLLSMTVDNDRNIIISSSSEAKLIYSYNFVDVDKIVESTKIFKDVIYSQKYKKYYACDSEKIYISSDGNIFEEVYTPTTITNIYAFAENTEYIIAIGSGTGIAYTTDGINWTSLEIWNDVVNLVSITSSEDYFVAVGEDGTIYYCSASSINFWTSQSISGSLSTIKTVCYSKERKLFVAGGEGRKIYYNGYQLLSYWQQITLPTFTGSTIRSIMWIPFLKMYVGTTTSVVIYSYDGKNWSFVDNTTINGNFIFVTKDEKIYIGTNDGKLFSSTDGFSWNEVEIKTPITDIPFSRMAEGEGCFVYGYGQGKMSKEYSENIINKLSSDSVLSMSLKTGNNHFMLNKTEGNFSCRIAYRQKYIGV